MQFLVNAWDFTDSDALNRRMANREAHLTGVRKLIAQGQFLSGGAILDDAGNMIGSTLHLDFPDRESLDAHLQADPYTEGKVWEQFDIFPIKLVAL